MGASFGVTPARMPAMVDGESAEERVFATASPRVLELIGRAGAKMTPESALILVRADFVAAVTSLQAGSSWMRSRPASTCTRRCR